MACLKYNYTGYEEEVYAALSSCGPHLNVYKKGGPELHALNYTHNDRIAPIVLEPEVGYIVVTDDFHGNPNGNTFCVILGQ